MHQETMTPRERWRSVLTRRKLDRVPMDYWATDEATENLMRYLRCEDERALFERLRIDKPLAVGPFYSGAPLSTSDSYRHYVGLAVGV